MSLSLAFSASHTNDGNALGTQVMTMLLSSNYSTMMEWKNSHMKEQASHIQQ